MLSGQHQHIGSEYLNPCGYIRDLAFLAAVGVVVEFRENDYEMAELDEARRKCSGSSSPRSTYSQDMIFWISLVGREGMQRMVAIEVVIGSGEVVPVIVGGREYTGGGGLRRGAKCMAQMGEWLLRKGADQELQ